MTDEGVICPACGGNCDPNCELCDGTGVVDERDAERWVEGEENDAAYWAGLLKKANEET